MFFSNTHWPQLMSTFYSILFETSICQNSIWVFSYNAWGGYRTPDKRSETFLHTESLQILQIHISMTELLLFSSSHSFSTGFRSEDCNGHSRSLVLCSVTHFCVVFKVCFVLLSGWKIQTWPIIRFSNRVTFYFFYLLVFDRIHDVMCLNKMSRTSSRNIGTQYQNIQHYITLYTWGNFYPCVHKTNLECCC